MDPRLRCASMSYDESGFSVNMTFRYLFQWTKLRVSLKITEAVSSCRLWMIASGERVTAGLNLASPTR